MGDFNCGYCLFAEETEQRSSDLVYCWIKEELRKINDYPCSRYKPGPILMRRADA